MCFRRKRIIETSDNNWLYKTLKSYERGVEFELSDDAALNITKSDVESGLLLIKKAQILKISWNRIGEIAKRMRLCSTSLAIIGYSILDEDPGVKLEELLSKDYMLISPKGLHLLKTLGKKFKVMRAGNAFKIAPYH